MNASLLNPPLLLGGLLLGRAGLGQTMSVPNYTPPPISTPPLFPQNMPYGWGVGKARDLGHRNGAGSYQLPDGSWQRARKLVFSNNQLLVRDSTGNKLRFTAETLRQLVVEKDTFLVVENLPGRQVPKSQPDFVRSCVNRQGLRLLAHYYSYGEVAYFLSRPNTPLVLLPTKKTSFKTVMGETVKDYPALAAKISRGILGPEEVVQIVNEYADFLRSNKAQQ